MKTIKTTTVMIALLTVTLLCSFANAGVSVEEAKRLKSDLTPLGAERAGNKEGTIPAWEGGFTEPPAGVTINPGDRYPDPFKDDKVLFSITFENMDKYIDNLNPGTIAMLKRYPDSYRLDVYKTRRTQAVPEWVYANTYENATRASLTEDGLGITGAYGGIPFPIPKRGEELIFNHILRYAGASRTAPYVNGVVSANGTYIAGGGGQDIEQYPYYFKDGSIETFKGEIWQMLNIYERPTRRKGELLIVRDPLNKSQSDRKAWQYFPGQRRVRRAPSVEYDTPDPSYSGLATYDDGMVFNGNIDRYDWKIIGKKEKYIPYNCYKMHNAKPEEVIMKGHANPNVIRWELHRVWELEATLKSGSRHIYAKRIFFLDEDSWMILLKDQYDGRGNLWRNSVIMSWNHYDLPANILISTFDYDLQKKEYAVTAFLNFDKEYAVHNAEKGLDEKFFKPEYLRKLGKR
jgi:hypothetical protein